MRVVPEGERLAPPTLCFICESSPIRDTDGQFQNVVDTQRDFNPPSLSHLSGRKYICDRCVGEAAHLLGFVSADELGTINEKLTSARAAAGNLEGYVSGLAKELASRLGEFAEIVPDQLVATPKDKNVVEEGDGSGA